MCFRLSKLLCITFLLFVVSVASASSTVTHQGVILATSLHLADIPTTTSNVIDNVFEPVNAQLANLGREFLQPPESSASLSNTNGNFVKPLPAGPAAMLMVLIGFICVSLVRDRRVWLTALAGLLWAGQTGIQALPQLALRLSHRNHSNQQLDAELTCPYYLENSYRLRSDIEGTQYIGLLHHLAGIPHSNNAFADTHLGRLIALNQHQKLHGKTFTYPHKNTFPSFPAIISEQYSLNSLFKCLASRARQFIRFSPAFIFAHLPRGPPLSG